MFLGPQVMLLFRALIMVLIPSQTKGIHLGGCFHLASITIKAGCHQLLYRAVSVHLWLPDQFPTPVMSFCWRAISSESVCEPSSRAHFPPLLPSVSWEVVWSNAEGMDSGARLLESDSWLCLLTSSRILGKLTFLGLFPNYKLEIIIVSMLWSCEG